MIKVRAIIKRPDERYGHVSNISCTEQNLQKTVDGRIQRMEVATDTVMLINADGNIFDLPKNLYKGIWPFGEVIRGTVVLIGFDGEDYYDCPLSFTSWKLMLKTWGND